MPPPSIEPRGAALLVGHGGSAAGPYLVLDRLEVSPWRRERFAPRGQRFTLELAGDPLEPERWCTGRHDVVTGQSLPCPEARRLAPDASPQCPACFRATGFNPAFYNAREVSPQQQARNREPHSVYLAWFGPGVVKVGMTHARRGLPRLLEQGARLGSLLTTCESADRARELEAWISGHLPAVESVRGSRKRQLLTVPLQADRARQELRELIGRAAELRPELSPDAEILELDAHYGCAQLLQRPPVDLGLTTPPAISGHCLGMVGDVLILEHEGQRFMISVGVFEGLRVALSGEQRRNRVGGQLSLAF